MRCKTANELNIWTQTRTLEDHKTFYLSHNKENVHIAKMGGAFSKHWGRKNKGAAFLVIAQAQAIEKGW